MSAHPRRVTDLDKFSLEEIWRPYWPMRTDLRSATRPHLKRAPKSLADTAAELSIQSKWSDAVIDRLSRCRYVFPEWVQHPLVDVVKTRIAERHAVAGEVAR